jgi:uncharacterized protein YpuA (DUF1002 family)
MRTYTRALVKELIFEVESPTGAMHLCNAVAHKSHSPDDASDWARTVVVKMMINELTDAQLNSMLEILLAAKNSKEV